MRRGPVPDWDVEQLEVITDSPESWQLVEAGPGVGKTEVACQRVASLIHDGIPAARILLISFTRTAVAELRERIVRYALDDASALSVRISTIDSHAWRLRAGFDDESFPEAVGTGGYDLNIERCLELFRTAQPELIDFMHGLKHIVVDEAQDVVGPRAHLVLALLEALPATCGVTILADPAQAIYGFTTDGSDVSGPTETLLDGLDRATSLVFTHRTLSTAYRIREDTLKDVFVSVRREAVKANATGTPPVKRVVGAIRSTCGNDWGATSYEHVTDLLERIGTHPSTLVLFRRRADALITSSYCSTRGIPHRLRLSGMPVVVHPWVGWLFGEIDQAFIGRGEFDSLWAERSNLAPGPTAGVDPDHAWELLLRVAAGKRSDTVDLVYLRQLVARQRPPVDLTLPDLGQNGPILSTIHASKGREADAVLLVIPEDLLSREDGAGPAVLFEEGRVYYVAATRARRLLAVARVATAYVKYLNSGRVYRRLASDRAQMEFGRDGDLDQYAHLSWGNAMSVYGALGAMAGGQRAAKGRFDPTLDYALRIEASYVGKDGVKRTLDVGQSGPTLARDIGALWSIVDSTKSLKPPPEIWNLNVVGVRTVALPDADLAAVEPPFRSSGFALAPVLTGFPTIPFFRRWKRTRYD